MVVVVVVVVVVINGARTIIRASEPNVECSVATSVLLTRRDVVSTSASCALKVPSVRACNKQQNINQNTLTHTHTHTHTLTYIYVSKST